MLHLEKGVGERCQEWPSPMSFKFYVHRGLPASRVKATAPWRSSLLLRNSGGRLWRRNWRLSGRSRTGTLGCSAAAHSTCWRLPHRLWASYQSGAPLTILAASCPQELSLCLSYHHPLAPSTCDVGQGSSTFAAPASVHSSSSVSGLLQSIRRS